MSNVGGQRAILGPNGLPYTSDKSKSAPTKDDSDVVSKSMFGYVNQYLQSLSNTRLPALYRAQDPFANHAWVFASAMMVAQVAAQAPFGVVRETEKELDQRRVRTKSAGRSWTGPKAGTQRRAVQRHITKSVVHRILSKSTEPDFDHPLMEPLLQPNPYQSGTQLMQFTYLWYHVRGECFWVLSDEDGGPPTPGEAPARIWPLSPDLFEPVLFHGTWGELVGWKFKPPRWMPNGRPGAYLYLDKSEVVQFKSPNPSDLTRGMSRLTSVASDIETDLLSRGHTAALLRNQAVPRGILTYEGELGQDQQKQFETEWKQKYEGVDNAGRTALLANGFKYQVVALSPNEMQFSEREASNQKEILAVMSTPPSVLGVTDLVNYATGLAQDKNFWDKTIIPMFRSIETTVDSSALMNTETDDVFALHDLRDIEALRAGVADKVTIAERLTSEKLHMPPRAAFEVVDLPVPDYLGDDVCLVGGLSTPVKNVLEEEIEVEEEPVVAPSEEEDPDEETPEGTEEDETPTALGEKTLAIRTSKGKRAERLKRWRAFIKVEARLEIAGRRAYRKWIVAARNSTLDSFDKLLGRKAPSIDLTAIIPNLKSLQDSMKSAVRPTYWGTLEQTFEFTLGDIGIPTFEIDDARIINYFDLREKRMLTAAPQTLVNNIRKSLSEGVAQAESIGQLRERLGRIFDISSSAPRTLTWARTEVGGLMNGVRNEMFEAQGFGNHSWVPAGDEHVRSDHEVFGNAGIQKIGFNFMSLVTGSGTLRHPGDPEGSVSQIANCRCLAVPED